MNKVLVVSNFYHPHIGGIEQTAQDCVVALKSMYDVKVICFNDSNKDSIEKINGVEVVKCAANIKISSQVVSLSFSRILRDLFINYQPDVVIFNYPNPFSAHYVLKYLTKTTKLILYWHSDIIKQKLLRTFFVNQNHRLLKRANLIISTSPNYILGSPYLSQYKEKCHVLPSCINSKRLTLTQGELQRAKTLKEKWSDSVLCIAVGRHVEYKGFEYLIRASELVNGNVKVLLVGEGPLTKKLKSISKNNEKVIFLGKLPDVELRKYLYISDIYCFPSITKNEAFGLSLAEAMFMGKPAITFKIPGSGVNYVSLNEVTGLEVENKNIQELAVAINKLVYDKDYRVKLGDNAQKRVNEMFLFESFSKSLQGEIELALVDQQSGISTDRF